jgi:secondary thiamine-phosphate synthase enzyme
MLSSKNNCFQYSIRTAREDEFTNITGLVENSIKESEILNGIAIVFCPHTTAGITLTENANSDVVIDMLFMLEKLFPKRNEYNNSEENFPAYFKASYTGSSSTIIVEHGHLKLGTCQGIYFCEFDGPKQRKVYVKIIEG